MVTVSDCCKNVVWGTNRRNWLLSFTKVATQNTRAVSYTAVTFLLLFFTVTNATLSMPCQHCQLLTRTTHTSRAGGLQAVGS